MALFDQIQSVDQRGEYRPGPELIGLNQARLKSIQEILNATGGRGQAAFIGDRPDLFTPSAAESGLIDQIQSLIGSSAEPTYNRFTPAQIAMFGDNPPAAESLARQMFQAGQADPSRPPTGLTGLQALLQGLVKTDPNQTISPYETQGLQDLESLTDPTALVDAYKGYFDKIAGPQIKNNQTIMGQSGGGAWIDAVGKYMANVAPQIEAARQGAVTNLGAARMGLGPMLEARNLNRAGSAFGMGSGINQMQTGLLPMLGMGRQGNLANYLLGGQTVNQALNAIPITNYGTQSVDAERNNQANFPAILGGAAGLTSDLSNLLFGNSQNGGLLGPLIQGGGSLISGVGNLINGLPWGGASMGTATGDILGTGALTGGFSDQLRSNAGGWDSAMGDSGWSDFNWGDYL